MGQNRILIIAVLVLVGFTQCKEKPSEDSPENYDKSVMLTNMTNNYIIPAYANFKDQTTTLASNISNFTVSPTESNLLSCRVQLKETTLAWQDVAMLEFGPAANISLRSQTNLYPADTTLINSNITSDNYNLELPSNFDAKGLQALDYLLYKPGQSNSDLVNYYLNSTHAKSYLIDVSNELKMNSIDVYNDWNSTYGSTFIENTEGNGLGSSVSEMVNALSLHYEAFVRKGKVGIPLGVFNGISQQIMPGHLEGVYSEYSLDYVLAEMNAISNFIKGVKFDSSTNGEGLDDYLDFVKAKNGTDDLSTAIVNQINTIESDLNNIGGSLADAINSNPSTVNTVYQSMQQLVPLIKVELSAALGVQISYQDSDGD